MLPTTQRRQTGTAEESSWSNLLLIAYADRLFLRGWVSLETEVRDSPPVPWDSTLGSHLSREKYCYLSLGPREISSIPQEIGRNRKSPARDGTRPACKK